MASIEGVLDGMEMSVVRVVVDDVLIDEEERVVEELSDGVGAIGITRARLCWCCVDV